MDSLSAETVFVAPHQPWRLAQTRYRLLPGLAALGVVVLVSLVLAPYANVAAVSGVRGVRFVEHAMRGALVIPAPPPTGAIARAQPSTHPQPPQPPQPSLTNADADTDADTQSVSRLAPPAPILRHDASPASPAKPHAHKGPLPPFYPGAYGGAGKPTNDAKPGHPENAGKRAQGVVGVMAQQTGRPHGKDTHAPGGRHTGNKGHDAGGGSGHGGGHNGGHGGGRR